MNKVLIIGNLDRYANGVLPTKLAEFFKEHSVSYELYNTAFLCRASEDEKSFLLRLPKLNLLSIQLYCLEVLDLLIQKMPHRIRLALKLPSLLAQMKVRGAIVHAHIKKHNYKNIIVANTLDSFLLNNKLPGSTYLYYPPAPWAEELYYSEELTKKDYETYRNIEYALYEKADYFAFQWHTYMKFIQKNGYKGNNIITLNYGCKPPQKKVAHYSAHPRIVFLGFLEGKWVNLKLLKQLSQIYPNLDIYGGPALDRNEFPNYKGYAPTLDVLSEYQFGLITITKDVLRRESFSSKHLEYLSYGLPVLTPDWRVDSSLKNYSIYYNVNNFKTVVKTFSDKKKWQEMSDKGLEYCKQNTWSETLKPLLTIFK